jgi:DNA-binding transcriptional MocR family regulator
VAVSPTSLHTADGGAQSGVRLTYCNEPPERLADGAKRLGAALAVLDDSRSRRLPRTAQALVGV